MMSCIPLLSSGKAACCSTSCDPWRNSPSCILLLVFGLHQYVSPGPSVTSRHLCISWPWSWRKTVQTAKVKRSKKRLEILCFQNRCLHLGIPFCSLIPWFSCSIHQNEYYRVSMTVFKTGPEEWYGVFMFLTFFFSFLSGTLRSLTLKLPGVKIGIFVKHNIGRKW